MLAGKVSRGQKSLEIYFQRFEKYPLEKYTVQNTLKKNTLSKQKGKVSQGQESLKIYFQRFAANLFLSSHCTGQASGAQTFLKKFIPLFQLCVIKIIPVVIAKLRFEAITIQHYIELYPECYVCGETWNVSL